MVKLQSQTEFNRDPYISDTNLFFIAGQAGGYGSETKVMGGFGTNLFAMGAWAKGPPTNNLMAITGYSWFY